MKHLLDLDGPIDKQKAVVLGVIREWPRADRIEAIEEIGRSLAFSPCAEEDRVIRPCTDDGPKQWVWSTETKAQRRLKWQIWITCTLGFITLLGIIYGMDVWIAQGWGR